MRLSTFQLLFFFPFPPFFFCSRLFMIPFFFLRGKLLTSDLAKSSWQTEHVITLSIASFSPRLVLSSGWLSSYSGSVGGACINNFTFSLPFSFLFFSFVIWIPKIWSKSRDLGISLVSYQPTARILDFEKFLLMVPKKRKKSFLWCG